MQTIYLDISNRGVIPVIYAKQNDVGRKVEVVLTNSGLHYEPEAGSAFSAWFSGASGVGNYTDVGDHSAFSVSGNKVTVELITQMLQNAGEGILCLVLSRANGEQIGLWNIRYICECVPGAGSEPAKDYYTAFSQAVADLPYPDVSLSAPGKAADAAAVGTALAGKAPAGYGLGESAPPRTIEDCNAVTQNGWYRTSGSTLNQPVARANWMRVDSHGTTYCHQTWFNDQYSGCIAERFMINGVWQPWEWVNPPMALGVEYRTTKRYNGKVIYAKALNLGALPNAGSASYSFGFTENVTITEMVARTDSGNIMPFYLNNAQDGELKIYNNSNTIWATTTCNWSSSSLIVHLEYVKG